MRSGVGGEAGKILDLLSAVFIQNEVLSEQRSIGAGERGNAGEETPYVEFWPRSWPCSITI